MKLPICGKYPPNWKEISDATWAAAGHRCIRCGHPYRKGEHGKGQWTPCDHQCTHRGPIAERVGDVMLEVLFNKEAGEHIRGGKIIYAEWRIGTVHHLDGNKSNCEWWNLLALCQRCHLQIQTKLNPATPYFLEHSDWFKPYVAGFYAHKYLGVLITRAEAQERLSELLALERLA